MPAHTVRFPTHIGAVQIEFGAAGPVHTWRGPEVYFSVGGMPTVCVSMQGSTAIVEVIGQDPQKFDALPEDLQHAAVWWQVILPTLAAAWTRFTAATLADAA
ncbi:MAG: hypothetical protein WBA46_06955 [Thermomicrobiales bacterium]